MSQHYPELFAAIVPICGGGNPDEAYRIKNIPVWAFYGAKDEDVPVEETRKMLQCDSMRLDKFSDNMYDLVYTSNGVHVWINDLNAMYGNIYRILKKDCKYMLFDTHTFARPFNQKLYKGIFEVVKPYEDVGPFGEVPTFGWRIQDYINALIKSGFTIRRMEEFHSVIDDIPACSYLFEENDINHDNFNWHKNPWAALPQCLGLCSNKG